MEPTVAVNVDAAVMDMVVLLAVLPKYTLFPAAWTRLADAKMVWDPLVYKPEKAKLLPALVTVLLVWMLIVDVPVVNAER